MSQRGRGSGPHEDDLDDEDAGRDRAPESGPLSPPARPIAPYDPYRSSAGDLSRRSARNVDDPLEPPARSVSRRENDDPYLPDDDPLSAEAWHLELEEVEGDEGDLDLDFPPPAAREPGSARRPRRQAPTMRDRAEPGATSRRAPRRAGTTGARDRMPRGPVAISVPRVVTSSSLAADQTALLLLAINGISLLLMVLLLGVRLGGLPSPLVLRFDAAGNPDLWGPPSVLWRLPVMAFFLTVMFAVVAWFLHPLDRFAARFALGTAAVAQLVAWVAVLQFLFMA